MLAVLFRPKGERKTNGDRMTEEAIDRERGSKVHHPPAFKRQPNGAWLLVRGLVKRPGKARPNQLSNSTLEFHQTGYETVVTPTR